MNRRNFLATVAVSASGLTLLSGRRSFAEPSCSGDISATIAANHGHILIVPLADIDAGLDQTYSIMGQGNHNHSVIVSAEQFMELKTQGQLDVQSSAAFGHSHLVILKCGGPEFQ